VKKLLTILLSIGLITSGSAHAASEDEQWPIPNEYGASHHSVLIEDSAGRYEFMSYLRMTSNSGDYLCSSLNSQNCASANFGDYNAVLPPCSVEITTDCIASFEAITAAGKILKGEFQEFIYGQKHPNLFTGDGISTPKDVSEPGIWKIDGAEHAFGSSYALGVSLSNSIYRNQNDLSGANLDIQAFPVSKMPTSFIYDDINGYANFYKCQQKLPSSGKAYVTCGGGAQEFGKYRCAMKMIENAVCLLRHAFPDELRFHVQVRFSHEPVGFMHGRLENPDITLTKSGDTYLLDVTAGSVKVPVLYSGGNFSSLPSDLQNYWNACISDNTCGFSSRIAVGNDRNNPLTRNIQDYAPAYGERSLKIVSTFAESVKDTSVAAPTSWNLKTLTKDRMAGAASCFTNSTGFLGVVTTNSTTYSEGPPIFSDDTLDYKVASLHYLPNGEVFKGVYSLLLRSDVARCLYGFSAAPIKAQISVISSEGKPEVAITTVSQRDNWLRLSATGFTFSSPRVRVKLSQDAQVATPTETAKTKTSITCTKGKLKKKVSGFNPKCPSGYKKAA
jgi:hypothetical protein